ncbi:Sec-independent protein translocase protein TatB [Thiomicrorhabdus sp. Milos-T2]|uniref:Sec-independent protein translocase protein TatB n=1 Tax=Thiomicrorhabdus sp. Milos-T2 TaxID=90814 RepID=UPI000494AD4F|nr:Sec-independent protein translocase protein TatB [Thiomicrorhabdus sp. Milos-T2]
MFDIGFLELMVILVIALLVIGPERMPEVARKIGSFMGKTRRFINSVKQEGQVQETLNEIKQSMDFEEEKQKMNTIGNELEQGLNFDSVEMNDLQRPTFGGDAPADSANQFNKAPSQPVAPEQIAKPNQTAQPVSSDADASSAQLSEQPSNSLQSTDSVQAEVSQPIETASEKENLKS